MISYVVKAIGLVASTVQNVILTASATGELILSAVLWICSVVMNVLDNVISFFHIVYEDNVLIFTEIPNSSRDIAYSAIKQLMYLQNGLEMACLSVYHKLDAIFSSSKSLTNALVLIVSEVLKLLVNLALFMGETIWLIITFPVHIPPLVRAAITYLLNILFNIIVDAYMKLLTFTNYLTEVPLESFLGIISAVVIVRLCVHFKETIVNSAVNLYWALVRNIMYFYHLCYNYFTNPEMQILTGMASGDVMRARENTPEIFDDANNSADVLCVICQERHKCVLTLPCRHICLCTECCRRLYGYQRTCPICRTFIYHSVTVYL